jgi:enoyl-[acyl-carrier protein] reductase II
MVATRESPIHDNWKQAIVAAAETDTVMLNRHSGPALRVLRSERTMALEFDTSVNAMTAMADHRKLYFDGDMDAALALSGQIAGRIEQIRPVAEVIRECAQDCRAVLSQLHRLYVQ